MAVNVKNGAVKKLPEFTDRELRCIAWMTACIGWIPDAWMTEIGGIAKKLRETYGDRALDPSAERTKLFADEAGAR